MKPTKPAKIHRAAQVTFRYWNSSAFRSHVANVRPAALPAREQCKAKVTARSYVAAKLAKAGEFRRACYVNGCTWMEFAEYRADARQAIVTAALMRSTGLPRLP